MQKRIDFAWIAEAASSAASQEDQTDPAVSETSIPTKNDGTADRRFTASKEAVAAGVIEPDQVLAEETNTSLASDTNEIGGNS